MRAFDFGFGPERSSVRQGATVTWENTGKTIHTVQGPGFFSKALAPGATYRHRFSKSGTFAYVCTLHPKMRGTVIVRPA